MASLALVFLISVAYSLHQKRLYSAQAEVYLSQENLANAINGIATQEAYDTATMQRQAATQVELASTTEVSQRALNRSVGSGLTAVELHNLTAVQSNPNSDILTFAVKARTKPLAIELTNAVAAAYIAFRTELDTSAVSRAISQANQEIVSSSAGRGNAAVVSSLESKINELKSLRALQTSNAQIVQRATQAGLAQPKWKRNLAAGIALGLIFGLLAAAIRDGTDTRIRSEQDLENTLAMPVLGRIPQPPSAGADRRASLLVAPGDLASAPIQLLRTSVELSLLGATTVLVTSAVEAEGKSTTVANLAITLARSGKHVVVLDLDMRRPRQNILMGKPRSKGFADIIRATATVDEALSAVPLDEPDSRVAMDPGSLRLLQPGAPPADVGEILSLPEARKLIGEVAARDDVDLVMIDSPPATMFGDAAALARCSDAVLAIGRLGVVTRPKTLEFSKLMALWSTRRLGIVITGYREPNRGYYAKYADANQRIEDPVEIQ